LTHIQKGKSRENIKNKEINKFVIVFIATESSLPIILAHAGPCGVRVGQSGQVSIQVRRFSAVIYHSTNTPYSLFHSATTDAIPGVEKGVTDFKVVQYSLN
jgi:hypothetical protein